jgi:hypothetical protein
VTSLRRAIRSLAGKGLAEVEPQRIDTGTVSRWTGWPVLRTMPDLALHGARREPVNRRLAHLGEVGPRVLADGLGLCQGGH